MIVLGHLSIVRLRLRLLMHLHLLKLHHLLLQFCHLTLVISGLWLSHHRVRVAHWSHWLGGVHLRHSLHGEVELGLLHHHRRVLHHLNLGLLLELLLALSGIWLGVAVSHSRLVTLLLEVFSLGTVCLLILALGAVCPRPLLEEALVRSDWVPVLVHLCAKVKDIII